VSEALASVETASGKAAGDENFPVGSMLIRPALRPHVHAFYNFARNGDDIADNHDLSAADKVARLERMAAVLTGAAETGSPSALALRASQAQTGVTHQHSLDLLGAFKQDAVKSRYANWAELLDYCRLSAMPVGRHVLDLHGEAAATTHPPSDALCAALQVLNHLQDCAGDLADMDRCYFPQDMLDAEGASVADLRGPAATPALRRVMDRMLDETDRLNDAAEALPRNVKDWRLRLETGTILKLSRRLAARLRLQDPLAGRVKLSRSDAVLSVASALRYLA
jgi:farnesyl-diphosphate farnesyltransferase